MNLDDGKDLALLSDFSAQKSQLKIIKFVCKFTGLVAFLYALYFWIIIGQPFIAATNLLFVLGYALPFVLIKYQKITLATLWFFSILAGHVLLLSTQIFTSETGFHFYYLLFPSGVFLLFSDKDKAAKIVLTLVGTILFFVCEFYPKDPLIELSKQAETWIFASTILVIVFELSIVMFIFSHMITSRENKLKEMASIDPLTGVNNRRNFIQVAESLYGKKSQQKKAFSLLLMDIDHFKQVNDTHGHMVGDNALRLIADLLKTLIRPQDILARYGGEEFILLLPETNLETACELAESIRLAVESLEIPSINQKHINCTLSCGVSQGDQNLVGLDCIVKQADDALYCAKSQGRNRVSCNRI
jgi:diguanylate cyclase (GGDEF)-like protein